MPNVPFNRYAVQSGTGYVDNAHQAAVLRFRNGDVERVWRAPLAIPLFWTTLLPGRAELAGPITVVDWRHAVERLDARRASWKAKTSPLLFRGFPVFADWVKSFGGGEVVLDLGGLDAWRVTPFLDAVGQMIDFLEDRSPEPGPLLDQEDAPVGFRRRKGAWRLEAIATDLHWPDEVPLFARNDWQLEQTTMGEPPFRAGPWPERRFEDRQNPEVRARADIVGTVQARIDETKLGVIGNLEGIERMRAIWREQCRTFVATASALVESAPAFAAKHHVFDDSRLWAERIEATQKWEKRMEAFLDQQTIEVREAMKRHA